MFYVLIFSLIAVLLVVAGISVRSRGDAQMRTEDAHHRTSRDKQKRKAQRAQSKQARRKRH